MPKRLGAAAERAKGWMRRRVASVAIIAGVSMMLTEAALAACVPGASAHERQLQRQIVALTRVEQQRMCGQSRSDFRCDHWGITKQQVQLELELFRSRNGGTCVREASTAPVVRTVRPVRQVPRTHEDVAFYCVRPSDGYFFPAPHAQFATSRDADVAADQCKFICADPAMELFVLSGFERETEEMISHDGRRPYGDLPNAFRYRTNSDFKRCDHQRYLRQVNALRARSVTPTDLANAIIPLPTWRPASGSSMMIPQVRA
jgi:hypothetical protein